jgi:hypothetical protein
MGKNQRILYLTLQGEVYEKQNEVLITEGKGNPNVVFGYPKNRTILQLAV